MIELDKKIEVRIAALNAAVQAAHLATEIIPIAGIFEQYILRGYNEDKTERDQASS